MCILFTNGYRTVSLERRSRTIFAFLFSFAWKTISHKQITPSSEWKKCLQKKNEEYRKAAYELLLVLWLCFHLYFVFVKIFAAFFICFKSGFVCILQTQIQINIDDVVVVSFRFFLQKKTVTTIVWERWLDWMFDHLGFRCEHIFIWAAAILNAQLCVCAFMAVLSITGN